jgi:hypothetical protein
VEFKHGTVFASSTLIPPEVNLQKTGDYQGGSLRLNVTMIFADLSSEIMAAALEMGRKEITRRWNCQMTATEGGIHGD